jgi:hypothetical protein
MKLLLFSFICVIRVICGLGLGKHAPVIRRPFQDQQHQCGQGDPFPGIIRLLPRWSGRQALRADLDGVARPNVALVGVEQVDGKATPPARPGSCVDADVLGVFIGKITADAARLGTPR